MCKPASFVITKNKVFWSKNTDSHEEIIKEFELCESGVVGANIVRVEIVPPDNNYTLPLDQWIYKNDQDLLPDWYDIKEAEKSVRNALPDWLAENVILPGQKVDVINKYIAACYGEVKCVSGGTIRYVSGGTIQCVSGGTIRYVSGGTIQDVRGGTIQDVSGGTIQCVSGGTIQYVRGGTVQEVKETGCVRLFHPDGKILRVIGPKAVVLDYTGKKIKIIKGK